MRAETRAYLIDIRERRRTPAAPPAPPVADAPPVENLAAASFLPHPHIAALSPSAEEIPLSPSPQEAELSPSAEEVAPSLPSSVEAKPDLKDFPLEALRLLGQGMIWRLNNLGIRTLDDLAASDPSELGEKLGPIGKLLRTDAWVQAAREIIAQG